MRLNPDDKTVAAMDLLVPKVGELIGGSQREERLQVPFIKSAAIQGTSYYFAQYTWRMFLFLCKLCICLQATTPVES